ncbi:MAG: helix-turn-helix domain-containing protein, partial [Sciscionella sp.]
MTVPDPRRPPAEQLTTHEAATEARCSTTTIYRALWSGALHGHRTDDRRGVRYKIDVGALAAWMSNRDSEAHCDTCRDLAD